MKCPLTEDGLCPGRSCPFWLHGECLVSQIDMKSRPDVRLRLDELRHELAHRDLAGVASAD
jgi:hypothetical protein